MSQYSGLSATFKTEVKKKGNKPRIGISLSGIAKYYSRGKAFTMDSLTYADELAGAPSVSFSSKITGGLSTINRLNLDILNQDLVSDHFVEGGTYEAPENSAVKAYLVYDSGTTLIADAVQFFNGIIDDFPQIDYKSLKIACTSIDRIIFHKVGDLVTNADAPSGYKVPEHSLGKMKPEIYGDHRFPVNYTAANSQLATDYHFSRDNNVVPAVALGGGQFQIANHEVKSLTDDKDAIWLYDEDIGKMVEVVDFTEIQNDDSNGCIISIAAPETILEAVTGYITSGDGDTFTDNTEDFSASGVAIGDVINIPGDENSGLYSITQVNAHTLEILEPNFPAMSNDANIEYTIERYPLFKHWRSPISHENNNNWVNPQYMYDLSLAFASVATVNVQTEIDEITLLFDTLAITPALLGDIKLYIKGVFDIVGAVLYVNNQAAYYFGGNTNSTQFHSHVGNVDRTVVNRVPLSYYKSGVVTALEYATISEIIQAVEYRKNIPTDNMKIYFGGTGRAYDTWLDSRTNHQDATTDLIENAAGCVESVLRDVVGLTTANIMNADFDSASTDLSTSKNSFSLTKEIESFELIHDMLERVKSVGFFNYDDKFRMVVYNSAEHFSEADDNTGNDDDKFLFTPTESLSYDTNTRQFDEHPIIKDSFWVRKNPANQIVTNFLIDYYKTHDGNFAKQLTTADGVAITDTTYHTEDITKKFSHPFTKDTTTAQIWLTFLKDRLNRKHWTCGFDTWYNAIGKEMWDVINVQHPILTNLITGVTTKKWRVLKIGIATDLGKISIEVEEQ